MPQLRAQLLCSRLEPGSARQVLPAAAPRGEVRRGEAVQCPFLLGHEEDLAVPVGQEGAGGARVLREQRWQ